MRTYALWHPRRYVVIGPIPHPVSPPNTPRRTDAKRKTIKSDPNADVLAADRNGPSLRIRTGGTPAPIVEYRITDDRGKIYAGHYEGKGGKAHSVEGLTSVGPSSPAQALRENANMRVAAVDASPLNLRIHRTEREDCAGFVKLGAWPIKGRQRVEVCGWRPNDLAHSGFGAKTT